MWELTRMEKASASRPQQKTEKHLIMDKGPLALSFGAKIRVRKCLLSILSGS